MPLKALSYLINIQEHFRRFIHVAAKFYRWLHSLMVIMVFVKRFMLGNRQTKYTCKYIIAYDESSN